MVIARSYESDKTCGVYKMAEEGIRLVVGLGNPGPKYVSTRHNVGYRFVDSLAARNGGQFRIENKCYGLLCRLLISGRDLRLLKPMTFMNRSGQSVAAVVRYFDIAPEQILIAHDELDLPVGTLRLKQGGGHAGHNGLRDIISALATRDFWRLRIGINHPGINHPEDRLEVVNYVLRPASRDDEERIRDALDQAEQCLSEVLAGEFQRAMHRLHSRQHQNMPIISRFFGIIIRMFYDEHNPPHFHVEYQDKKAVFDFQGNILKGNLSSKIAPRLVREWTDKHVSDLEEDWGLAREGKEIKRIDPLD